MIRRIPPYIIMAVCGAGCGVWGAPAAAQAPRTANRAPRTALPAIPRTNGPLELRVVYPPAGSLITARDSNFIFGSTGSGDAGLTIDGAPVEVAPNGAFLAFLPVPAGDSAAVYRLVARRGADSVAQEHRVRLPRRSERGSFVIDRGSIEPRGNRWVEPGELIRVSAVVSPADQVWLQLPGGARVPLAPEAAALTPSWGPFDRQPSRPGAPDALVRWSGAFPAVSLGAALPPVTVPAIPAAAVAESLLAQLVAVRGLDTLRERIPLRLTLLDPARRAVVILDDDTARLGNTDGAVVGKPLPNGTFEWFLRNGTLAAVSGRSGDHVRLALSRGTAVWSVIGDVARALPEGTPPPGSRVALVRLTPGDSSVTARVALSSRIPFKVEESERSVTLRFYGAQADLDWLQYGGTDTLVRRMWWAQPSDDEVTVTFELGAPVWGYRSHWQGTDLLFEIRRPPVIDRRRPLRGRVIAVDPGHPPQGATGPTGFMEKDANLAVGLVLRRLLERAGARVIMTRTIDTAIGLYERTNEAERQGAEVLVSIHNNAFPDGVNPFVNSGTSAYYFQPRSTRLALLVQEGMLREMGLRNLGIGRGDLALVRVTWMPSVLTEGAFMMLPDQENALKTPSFQERYARGVLRGLEAWLRELR